MVAGFTRVVGRDCEGSFRDVRDLVAQPMVLHHRIDIKMYILRTLMNAVCLQVNSRRRSAKPG